MAAVPLTAPDGLLGHVVRLNIAVDRVLTAIVGHAGISVSDYLVLGTIRRSPGHRSAPTAIAEELGRTTGGMSLTLDRLQAAGLVRRLPDPADRRRVVVEATDDGVALATRVNRELHRWEDSLGVDDGGREDLTAAVAHLTELIEGVPTAALTTAPTPLATAPTPLATAPTPAPAPGLTA